MDIIGKYKLIRELGRGATGQVYLAQDPFNNREVAIKLMFPEMLKDREDGAIYRDMFINEASLAGKIIHPHIVPIYDAVVEEAMSYIVMEYVEGGTLEKFCTPDNLLPLGQIVDIAFKCVRALAFAHMEGLIHRDIKPGNILHKSGTDIKVSDFGAAVNRVSNKTIAAAIGSPLYMAPELITGARATMQSDIYALGVVMYYLLTGRPLFAASNPASMTYQIVNHEPEPVAHFREGIPAAFEDIVKQAIAKNPARRYQSWEEIGKDLALLWQPDYVAQQTQDEPSDIERFNLLKGLPFFRNFPESELWEVMRISLWRSFPPGQPLIKEGDVGDSFFLLAKGTAKVTRGKKLLNVLGMGCCEFLSCPDL